LITLEELKKITEEHMARELSIMGIILQLLKKDTEDFISWY
jgi:hypothetical protein